MTIYTNRLQSEWGLYNPEGKIWNSILHQYQLKVKNKTTSLICIPKKLLQLKTAKNYGSQIITLLKNDFVICDNEIVTSYHYSESFDSPESKTISCYYEIKN